MVMTGPTLVLNEIGGKGMIRKEIRDDLSSLLDQNTENVK